MQEISTARHVGLFRHQCQLHEDQCRHPLKRVRCPTSQGINFGDGVDALGGVVKDSSNMFGTDKGDGASRKASSGKDCEGV